YTPKKNGGVGVAKRYRTTLRSCLRGPEPDPSVKSHGQGTRDARSYCTWNVCGRQDALRSRNLSTVHVGDRICFAHAVALARCGELPPGRGSTQCCRLECEEGKIALLRGNPPTLIVYISTG